MLYIVIFNYNFLSQDGEFEKIANNVVGVVNFSKKCNLPPPLLLGTVEEVILRCYALTIVIKAKYKCKSGCKRKNIKF